jgi:signal transduction histidine kinase
MHQYKDHTLLFICIGGIFLAAIYHTILYFHRKQSLLNYYSQYLWVLFIYLIFRLDLYLDFTGLDTYNSRYNWDEVIQMLSYMFYIRFLCKALFLRKSDNKYAWFFYKINAPVILGYCFFIILFDKYPELLSWLKIVIRVYLLTFGLLSVLIVWEKKRSLYHSYLFIAAVSMIFFGLLSSLSMILNLRFGGLGPFYWLLVAFYTDVIFFSAALGYLIKQEYQKRESSLKQLLKKEAELQQKELEKMKVVYETREEERIRIARDLHDDMGSTLSSISIYGNVVSSYIDTDTLRAHEYLNKIRESTKHLMENTSDLIWSLQTNYGESESIFKRMQVTGLELLSSANILSHFSIAKEAGDLRLSIMAQKNCWLIFKEVINNVCKYSKASSCTVSVTVTDNILHLIIKDDGIGFKTESKGNGLLNIRNRTEQLGGISAIRSQQGEGTVVNIQFPVENIQIRS